MYDSNIYFLWTGLDTKKANTTVDTTNVLTHANKQTIKPLMYVR